MIIYIVAILPSIMATRMSYWTQIDLEEPKRTDCLSFYESSRFFPQLVPICPNLRSDLTHWNWRCLRLHWWFCVYINGVCIVLTVFVFVSTVKRSGLCTPRCLWRGRRRTGTGSSTRSTSCRVSTVIDLPFVYILYRWIPDDSCNLIFFFVLVEFSCRGGNLIKMKSKYQSHH